MKLESGFAEQEREEVYVGQTVWGTGKGSETGLWANVGEELSVCGCRCLPFSFRSVVVRNLRQPGEDMCVHTSAYVVEVDQ